MLSTDVPNPCDFLVVVVVDGSKSYNSSLEKIVSNNSNVILKYIHNKNDTGLDKAYDDAVKHSTGKYCWLATDDDEPEKFLAYNNGISLTATQVKLKDGHIEELSDMQIVNGGQTAASIFFAPKDSRDGFVLSFDRRTPVS